jgi:prepilin-type processing-associated H-X9-DG protein/prepilin-type N-terminal cleavage/methylation domain-containing protein
MQRPAAKAFTLIELLMVVSIIALLIAILMPALGRARTTASNTVCKTRIKGLCTALMTFTSSHEDTYPKNGIILPKPGGRNTAPTTGYGNGDPNPDHWDLPYGALWDYMNRNPKAYMCDQDLKNGPQRNGVMPNQIPLQRDPKARWVNDDGTPVTGAISVGVGPNGFWSYSVNSVLNSEGQFRTRFYPRDPAGTTQQPWIDPIKWVNIARPADFFVFIEEDNNSPFNDEVFDAPAYNGGDKLTDRHNNGGNVGFADGHVEWFSDVVFNNAPSAGSGSTIDHWGALQYPITRSFFPDGGSFATPP